MLSKNYICLTVVRFCPLSSSLYLVGRTVTSTSQQLNTLYIAFLFILPSLFSTRLMTLSSLCQLMDFIPFSRWMTVFLFHIPQTAEHKYQILAQIRDLLPMIHFTTQKQKSILNSAFKFIFLSWSYVVYTCISQGKYISLPTSNLLLTFFIV